MADTNVVNNTDIDIEEEESEEEGDGEEIVVQGSMQFNLTPKQDAATVASVDVRPVSPSVRHVDHSVQNGQKPEIPLDQLVSATLRAPNGSVIYVIGTAHFSVESQNTVKEVISRVRPDIIVLELCASRSALLQMDENALLAQARELNMATIRSVVRSLGVVMGTMHLLLLSMSAEITRVCGMAPGGEFRCAVAEARKIPNCFVSLGDRPIDITVKRAFHALSLWQKLKFAFHVVFQSKISKDDIEKCMQEDSLQAIMEELGGKFPELSRVFIAERDAYLAYSLQVAASADLQHVVDRGVLRSIPRPVGSPKVVVGVVGLGHVEGIKKRFGCVQPEELVAVMTVPKPSVLGKVVRLSIKVGFWCVVIYGVKKVAPRPAFLSPENLNPRIEQLNHAVRDLTTVDLINVGRSASERLTSAFGSAKDYVGSYL